MWRGKKVSESYCRASFFFGIIRQLVPFIYHTLGSADSIAYKRHTCIYALSLSLLLAHICAFSLMTGMHAEVPAWGCTHGLMHTSHFQQD